MKSILFIDIIPFLIDFLSIIMNCNCPCGSETPYLKSVNISENEKDWLTYQIIQGLQCASRHIIFIGIDLANM